MPSGEYERTVNVKASLRVRLLPARMASFGRQHWTGTLSSKRSTVKRVTRQNWTATGTWRKSDLTKSKANRRDSIGGPFVAAPGQTFRGPTTICSRARIVDIQSVVGGLTGTCTVDLIRSGFCARCAAGPGRASLGRRSAGKSRTRTRTRTTTTTRTRTMEGNGNTNACHSRRRMPDVLIARGEDLWLTGNPDFACGVNEPGQSRRENTRCSPAQVNREREILLTGRKR